MTAHHDSKLAKWDKLDSDTVFDCPIYHVKRSRMVCPRNGVERDYFTFICPDWVNIVAITPDQRMVMIRQYRVGTSEIELEIPGGGLDGDGEDPIVGGARELLEETGYAGENGTLIGSVCPNPALQTNLCHTVLFENVAKVAEPAFDETEDIETLLVPLREVKEKMRGGRISHGLVLNALQFWEHWRER